MFNDYFAGLMVIFDAGTIGKLKEPSEETREKTRGKIISEMINNSTINIIELSIILNISRKGVEWQKIRFNP
jgi:hypothetical protein